MHPTLHPNQPYGMTVATYLSSVTGSASASLSNSLANVLGDGSGGDSGNGGGSAAPPPAGTLAAYILEPPGFVAAAANGSARVALNASGSSNAPLRPIVVYSWSVKRLPGGQTVASAGGREKSVTLPSGLYAVYLTVTDIAGQFANTSKAFAVWPSPFTVAAIGSPPAFVQVGGDSDATQVCAMYSVVCGTHVFSCRPPASSCARSTFAFNPCNNKHNTTTHVTHTQQFLMSANGSAPAPGRNLTYFVWRVASAPDGRLLSSVAGYAGYVKLPTGSYTAQLTVFDSAGANATAVKPFVIGASSNPAAGAPEATARAAISVPPPAVAQASGSGLTRVALDATGSAPAGGAVLVNALWAVVTVPSRTPAGSGSGLQSAVVLGPGSYQVRVLGGGACNCFITIRSCVQQLRHIAACG